MSAENNPPQTMEEWLRGIGLEQFVPTFESNHISFDTLRNLTDEDLQNLGISSLGHRKQILGAISDLQTSSQTVAVHQIPKKLGHFELLEPIGQGGIGTVYRAWDGTLNRQVALKLLDHELASADPQFHQDFIREAQNAASINHPHIVQIYFAGEENGEFYIVMELLEGQNMADRIARGPMDEKKVLRLARQIVEALAATQIRRLIHGDIKPHNIFITKSGDAKLLDFGLARKSKIHAVEEGSFIGSAIYVSPERVASQPEDFRSDIYSLGATLFEALTGLPPFDAETPAAVATKRLSEDAPHLRSLKPTASPALEHLIDRMLARDIQQRQPSYEALLEDITAAESALLSEFDPTKKLVFNSLPVVVANESQKTITQELPAKTPVQARPVIAAPIPHTPVHLPPPSLWKRLSGSKFFLVSVGIHLLIGLVATVLVVQTITAKRKLTFKGGPPSPNPSQRSVEHRVQMAKKQQTMSAPSQPRRVTTTNALAKVSLPDMPAMPSLGPATPSKMAGMGGTGIGASVGGLGMAGGGMGGGGLTMFGLSNTTAGALVGTFYDLKQTADKKPTGMDQKKWVEFVQKWINTGWKEEELEKFYAGPKPLYAPYLFVPIINADEGPKAFGLEKVVKPGLWVAHYKAKVMPSLSGRFRFVGLGDDTMIIRLNGSIVFAQGGVKDVLASPAVKYSYAGLENSGDRGPVAGKWFEVTAGSRYDMEVLIGECPGGLMHAYLLLEKSDGVYEKDSKGIPIFPIFRLSKALPPDMNPKTVNSKVGAHPPFSITEAPWSVAPKVGFGK